MLARPSPLLRLAAAALAALGLAACGGSETDEREFIAPSRAEALERTLERVEGNLADSECDKAQAGVARLRSQVDDLPERSNGRLVSNLIQWVEHLDGQVPQDCQEEEPEETPTPVATPEEEETPEETVTPEATETPAPTPTATPVPTQPPASPLEPPDEGGAAAPDEDGVAP